MLAKRIIPCLDIENGRVVKGVGFSSLKYAGDPVLLARKYYRDGADELALLDITASYEKRKTMKEVVMKVSREIFIPLTVGGGVSTIYDIRDLLNSGADKVSINTAAVINPGLIRQASEKFGSQCIVIAIDAKRIENTKDMKWNVFLKGGSENSGLDAIKWAKKAESLGAGELLVTSMDKDGGKEGYDVELTRKISESVNIPVIASGGAGSLQSISKVLTDGKADAALAASIFHYNKYSIDEVKAYLISNGIGVRP
jgi:imidazole glycerol-phosphate synthase subunit HisF